VSTHPSESRNRLRAASRLLSTLDTAAGGRINPGEILALDATDWARCAAISGCRPPSASTIAVVVELAAQRRVAS
jgi:hypothetical protein